MRRSLRRHPRGLSRKYGEIEESSPSAPSRVHGEPLSRGSARPSSTPSASAARCGAMKFLDLKGRLRCGGCGRKGRAVVSIKWGDRARNGQLTDRGPPFCQRRPRPDCRGLGKGSGTGWGDISTSPPARLAPGRTVIAKRARSYTAIGQQKVSRSMRRGGRFGW
jgi:hypothetical protein